MGYISVDYRRADLWMGSGRALVEATDRLKDVEGQVRGNGQLYLRPLPSGQRAAH